MKILIVRIFLSVALPGLILYAVIARIWTEMKTIPFYCWCDVRGEWGSFKHLMGKDTLERKMRDI